MFLHDLKYNIICIIRSRDLIFWLILFPIALGTCFKVAFGSIYKNVTEFHTVPAAIVETEENAPFRSFIQTVEDSGVISAEYTDEEYAVELLKAGKVSGIIYSGEELTLTVSGTGIAGSTLRSLIDNYKMREKMITDTVKNAPEKTEAVIKALSEETSACISTPLTKGNTDNFTPYFYNLIAMVAMYGCLIGRQTAMNSLPNYSAIGIRRSCSAIRSSAEISSGLIAGFAAEALCMTVCVTFIEFVLKVDLGGDLLLIYLTAILGGILGVALGFCVCSSFRIADGILTASILLLCFMSGLMINNMKMIVAEKAPWFNMINPPALISDSLYCLSIYSDLSRYAEKTISIAVITAVLCIIGVVITRRRRYASL